MLNKEKVIIYVSVVTTIVCTSCVLWIKFGFDVRNFLSSLIIVTLSTIISYIIIWLIRNYLWKWKYIKSMFGNYPNLNGDWDVVRKRHDEQEPEYRVAKIKQKWDKFSLSYNFGTTKLKSTQFYFEKEGEDFKLIALLTGIYDPERNQNPNKDGKIETTISLLYHPDTNELIGEYWAHTTKVPKQGSLIFKKNKNETGN